MTDNSKKAKSQCTKLIKYLETHKKGISDLEALEKLHIRRLSGRIYDLRWKYGKNIETVYEQYKNDEGNMVRYGRYYLR